MNHSDTKKPIPQFSLDGEDALEKQETPWEEFLRVFQSDRQGVAGFVILMVLLVMALTGKVLTEWWVIFDPEVVRLPDKFLPPFSYVTEGISQADRPLGGVYLLGTDELGRDVFAPP